MQKGAIITDEMFTKWFPEILKATENMNARPVHSARNKISHYVKAVAA